MNIVTFFWLRGVTPVTCDTERSSSSPVVDRSSTSRKKYFARFSCQCAGISPSHGRPEALYSGYGRSAPITFSASFGRES